MDRRGLRRHKAEHINPIPLFVLGIMLYIMEVAIPAHEVPWWSYPAALAAVAVTGFSTYMIQSRYAENASPIYFAIFLFIVYAVSGTAIFDKSLISAAGLSIAYRFAIKYACGDKQKDHIAIALFICILSSTIAPAFIWFLPCIWGIIFAESDKKTRDSLLFLLGTVISASAIFGTIYLFSTLPDAIDFAKRWLGGIFSDNAMSIGASPLVNGLCEPWTSVRFATSVTYCLLAVGGIVIFAIFMKKHRRIKIDDAVIAGVSFLLAIVAIALTCIFPENSDTLWLVIAANISVPASHLLAREGKHIWVRIYLFITFLWALMSIFPVTELL